MSALPRCICHVTTCCSKRRGGGRGGWGGEGVEGGRTRLAPLSNPPISILTGEGARGFPSLHYYLRLQPGHPHPLPFFPSSSTVYVINTPFPQWVAVGGGGQGEGQGWGVRRLEKEQNNAFFHQKFPLFLYLKVFSSEPLERWATMWPHSEHLFTIWNTPPVNWRRQRRGEEKSCVIYDTGPCSYMGSPLHVDSKVWPPYARRLKCVFRK